MEKRRGNTKQRIIEESMKLFSVHGFEAVSIRTIADAVGVGNSALYKHFKSKKAEQHFAYCILINSTIFKCVCFLI